MSHHPVAACSSSYAAGIVTYCLAEGSSTAKLPITACLQLIIGPHPESFDHLQAIAVIMRLINSKNSEQLLVPLSPRANDACPWLVGAAPHP